MFKKSIALVTMSLALFSAVAFAGQPKVLPAGSKIHIQELGSGLESYLKAELLKQKLPITIVNDETAADFIISGTGENKDRKWHEGFITRTRDNATGAIELMRRDSKEVVWASEAGDRSMWKGAWSRDGQRKVANRLANNLKDIIGREAK
jgi:hypothetical protein